MIEYVSIDSLNPADYNPRMLSENAQRDLINSITALGVIKPIIIRKSDNRIMAGHQRTKTMKLMGIKEVPAFILDGVNSTDEVRFNQLHNFAESEVSDNQPILRVNIPSGVDGFHIVPNSDIQMIQAGEENSKVANLSKMILKYGQFANAICDNDGYIIISSVYAKTVKLLGMPLLVYVLPKSKKEIAVEYFSKEYGVFEYSHLTKNTYIQSFAQKMRLREKNGVEAKGTHSVLYETQVLPFINKYMRILDFGAGQKDYATMLKKKGYKIDVIEFFHRKDNVDVIDKAEIRRDCADICNTLATHGLYDVVICDSVLNSVNSLDDERNVLISLSALCKKGGVIFWSGIPLDFSVATKNRKKTKDYRAAGLFLDKNYFTANYRFGEWYYQHYHDIEYIERINRTFIGNTFSLFNKGTALSKDGKLNGSSFQVKTINEKVTSFSEQIESIKQEFSMPLPRGRRWDLDKMIIPILEKIMEDMK